MFERPVTFDVAGARLLGIVHETGTPATTGLLVVVGGPQYRIGAHRQFVHLTRHLAAHGIPAMRFDYRGIGDSEGTFTGFGAIGPDIDGAITAFRVAVPSLQKIVLWGLCDAASAIVMKENFDDSVAGAVVLNPWVRTEAGEARTYLRHYYRGQLADRRFWKRLLTGGVRLDKALVDAGKSVLTARARDRHDLPDRVFYGIERLQWPALLVLSGQDLVAKEFEDTARARGYDLNGLENVRLQRLPQSDHTFSRAKWKDAVASATLNWIREKVASPPV